MKLKQTLCATAMSMVIFSGLSWAGDIQNYGKPMNTALVKMTVGVAAAASMAELCGDKDKARELMTQVQEVWANLGYLDHQRGRELFWKNFRGGENLFEKEHTECDRAKIEEYEQAALHHGNVLLNLWREQIYGE